MSHDHPFSQKKQDNKISSRDGDSRRQGKGGGGGYRGCLHKIRGRNPLPTMGYDYKYF